MSVNLYGRDFLTLKDFTTLEIHYLLNLSRHLKEKRRLGVKKHVLSGKNIVLLFEKPSTRTRCAFEVAGYEEGAHVTFLENNHIGDKESLEDTAKVLGRYYDGIEFRGFSQTTIECLAKFSEVPVWNGLTDLFHPTQALADVLTIMEHVRKPLHKVKIVFVGNVRNNVCRSLMIASAKLGMQFVGIAPPVFYQDNALLTEMQQEALRTGARLHFTNDIKNGVYQADVIYTDVWVSMGEEAHFSEHVGLLHPFQVTLEMLLASENPDIRFMHCLPACHDATTKMGLMMRDQFGSCEMEVTDEVFRSQYSIVFDQAENRLHTIKAILVATMSGDQDKD